MTRKRAIKLLMSVSGAGDRVYVGKVMDLDQYKGKTNKEKLVSILLDFAFFEEVLGDEKTANRCKIIARIMGLST